MKRLVALAVVLAVAPLKASAQSSKEYAVMGQKLWAAFECAALATVAEEVDEQRRLFDLGYEQGKIFVQAIRNGKIEEKDLSGSVPVGVLWKLEGPNADFILGRIWESAFEQATKDAYDAYSKMMFDKGVLKQFAKNDFHKKNCSLM
jgi:hypothetical protein